VTETKRKIRGGRWTYAGKGALRRRFNKKMDPEMILKHRRQTIRETLRLFGRNHGRFIEKTERGRFVT